MSSSKDSPCPYFGTIYKQEAVVIWEIGILINKKEKEKEKIFIELLKYREMKRKRREIESTVALTFSTLPKD